MRVPICITDLTDGGGFHCSVVELQRNWPSPTPLSTTSAQYILARGFGYVDFGQLRQSLHEVLPCAPFPTEDEVKDSISTSIFLFISATDCGELDESKLQCLAEYVPLRSVTAFRPAADHTEKLDPNQLIQERFAGISDQIPAPATIDLLNREQLEKVSATVHALGKPRDQLIFEIIFQGGRLSEITRIKHSDIRIAQGQACISIESPGHLSPSRLIPLSRDGFLRLEAYRHQSKLTEDDYLFTSERHPKEAMPCYELSKIVQAYLVIALPQATRINSRLLHLSAVYNFVQWCENNSIPLPPDPRFSECYGPSKRKPKKPRCPDHPDNFGRTRR